MRKSGLFLLAGILFGFLASCGRSVPEHEGKIEWKAPNIHEALKVAKAEKKPVMIYFSASW